MPHPPGHDPLYAATLRSKSDDDVTAVASAACLTLVGHPDVERLGQRRVLGGEPVEVSRTGPDFDGAPLADPYLSRQPVVEVVSRWPVAVELVPAPGARVSVDGVAIEGGRRHRYGFAEVTAGLVIELGTRIALLLHATGTGPRAPAFDLIGESDAIARVRAAIARVADLDVSVLIRGETGVGKERVAQAIHAASSRRDGPCVAVNLAAVPASTAASELFGHARGAFTGAAGRHAGLFERADGGTLFLDEVGEAPDTVQAMLLRALETREVLPVGGDAPRAVDVRVVAATDADLEAAGAQGRFRAALLHRLAGYEITVPPLRDRKDDVARLLLHFLRRELDATGERHRLTATDPRATPWLPCALLVRLCRHDWPGNVRQLANVARQLVISSRGSDRVVIDGSVERLLGPDEPDDATPPPSPAPPATAASASASASEPPAAAPAQAAPAPRATTPAIDDAELVRVMRAHNWAPGPAAKALGLPSSTLHDLILASPSLRRARDVPDDELRACFAACGGDLDAMSERLQVSKRGLRLRLTRLGVL